MFVCSFYFYYAVFKNGFTSASSNERQEAAGTQREAGKKPSSAQAPAAQSPQRDLPPQGEQQGPDYTTFVLALFQLGATLGEQHLQ
jgi:hypothetical protein